MRIGLGFPCEIGELVGVAGGEHERIALAREKPSQRCGKPVTHADDERGA